MYSFYLSKIKGGKLLEYIYPAKVVSLIISDVIGDSIDIIGSGITSVQKNNYKEYQNVIKKYELQNSIPSSLLEEIGKCENMHDMYELDKIVQLYMDAYNQK